jgi:peptide deformylase
MFRKILVHPNSKLRSSNSDVADVSSVQDLIKDLIDTCNVEMGAGLAAPQIGVNKKVVVIKPKTFGKDNPDPSEYNPDFMVLINPQLNNQGDQIEWVEACLSIPSASGKVKRSETTLIKYTSETGEQKRLIAEWPLSGGLQHECDHLEGILYIHRMDKKRAARLLESKRKKERKERIRLKRAKRAELGVGKGRRK